MYRAQRCRDLGRCCAACPYDAISFAAGTTGPPHIDRSICSSCSTFDCVGACFSEALTVSGRSITVDELLRILERDRNFWGPGGGVTFGGGEPLLQRDFTLAALDACRSQLMHTAMETSAHVPRNDLMSALERLEWLFVDIKHMDPDIHREGTGVDNRLILDNIAAAADSGWQGRLVVRIPIVPGFNDDPGNSEATAEFLADHGVGEVHLVPFHRLGASKYHQLGLSWPFENMPSPTASTMQRHAAVFQVKDITCHIGSNTPF